MTGAPLRVLALTHAFPRYPDDPIGSFVLRLAVALRERNVTVTVAAPHDRGLPSRDEFEGIEVRRFRYAPARWENLAYTGTMRTQVAESLAAKAAMLGFLASEAAAGARMRTGGFDLMHAHWWFPSGLVASGLRRVLRRPVVTTLHGSDIRAAHGARRGPALFGWVARHCDALTTVSTWLADEVRAIAPDVHPIVAPMPVDPRPFFPPTAARSDRLLFVGKLNEQKGIAFLLDALGRMRAKPMVDVVLGVGSTPGMIEEHARELGLWDRLVFHGLLPQSELADRYRRARMLVMPAIEEGLGLVAVEAMLCETPVVAFASGGLVDIVSDGVSGHLVPPRDVDGLAAALDALIADPARTGQLGQAARREALARFAPEAAARRYEEIYRGVLAGVQ